MTTVRALRHAADAVLCRIEGLEYEITEFRHHRRRPGDSGGCYHGAFYFNSVEVTGNSPELQLTRSAPRGRLRYGTDLFSVWVIGHDDLVAMVIRPVAHFVDWSFYSYLRLDDDGHMLVFPANRQAFGRALAGVISDPPLRSCQGLRDAEPGR